jgi:hypothetical protein
VDELFSCRNCVNNSGQTLNIGRGIGYCLQHSSIIRESDTTTCKYLRRKDLPWFVVDEARSEHAAEFSAFSGLVGLYTHEAIKLAYYSEKFAWENSSFDSVTNALARYHFSGKKWIFIESFTGGIDGRRAVAQASLTRRYMGVCDTWKSSFRLTLDVVHQLASKPAFLTSDLYEGGNGEEGALWDVVFSRLALVQEYGWHAGLPDLQWITDSLASLHTFAWEELRGELEQSIPKILNMMFQHASENNAYFEPPPVASEDVGPESEPG